MRVGEQSFGTSVLERNGVSFASLRPTF